MFREMTCENTRCVKYRMGQHDRENTSNNFKSSNIEKYTRKNTHKNIQNNKNIILNISHREDISSQSLARRSSSPHR